MFNLRLFERMPRVCMPASMIIAENMSYNHGPMISKKVFDDFVAPYYRQLIPRLLELNILPLVDTDGDLTVCPWLTTRFVMPGWQPCRKDYARCCSRWWSFSRWPC